MFHNLVSHFFALVSAECFLGTLSNGRMSGCSLLNPKLICSKTAAAIVRVQRIVLGWTFAIGSCQKPSCHNVPVQNFKSTKEFDLSDLKISVIEPTHT